MKPVRLVVLLTGDTPPPVTKVHGDFAGLFRSQLQAGENAVEVDFIDVTTKQAADALDDLRPFDGVIMSGSAAMIAENEGWMQRATRTVAKLIDDETPFLGVCFGHQILGQAVGADVGTNPQGREMGTIEVTRTVDDDPLVSSFPHRWLVNVSHADVIRAGGDRLQPVATAAHDPFHVVRAGPVAWGVQFHPEFTAEVTRAYLHHRKAVLDQERGEGAMQERLDAVQSTPDNHKTLSVFSALVRRHRDEKAGVT